MNGKDFKKLLKGHRDLLRRSQKATSTPDDDDMGEMWRTLKGIRQEKRAHNRASSTDRLAEFGVPFQVMNSGAHIVIRFGRIWIDFWPGTGLFHARTPAKYESRGIFNLLRYLDQHHWQSELPKPNSDAPAAV